jgi:hypothetical protein
MVQCFDSGDLRCGGMAEWLKAVVLKTTVGATSPGVRIPLPPPALTTGRAVAAPPLTLGEVPEYGRSGAPAKCLYGLNPVPRVQIPASPPRVVVDC